MGIVFHLNIYVFVFCRVSLNDVSREWSHWSKCNPSM